VTQIAFTPSLEFGQRSCNNQAFQAANGSPFLVNSSNVTDLYVNPSNIAYWHKYG